jgi:hypothetical protein
LSLAALICAYHEAADPEEGLRATLPLAGRTVLERQARLAASAGAASVVILIERLPAELAAAIDRMRSEGISPVVARTVDEAAEAVQAVDRVLLMGDGVVADPAQVLRLVKAGDAAVLTVPDQGADDRYERIDATSRWAGLALVDGELLHRTAAKLNDWDLQSTLLRRAVQSGARQLAVRDDEGALRLTIAERAEDLAAAETSIVERAGSARDDWASRFLLSPVEHSLTNLLMPTTITPDWLHLLAATLTGLAAVLFTDDWRWIGVICLLLSTPLDGAAERLAALRMQPSGRRGWARAALPYLAGAALAALAWSLSRTAGWGTLALAAATLAFMAALRVEKRAAEVPSRLFLAERKGMIWGMLPFAVTGSWVAGLGALVAYAAGSFFWVQRHAHGHAAPPKSAEKED